MANKYTTEYKVQAVKLAMEVGTPKAAGELGISENTIYGWVAKDMLLFTAEIIVK